MTDLSALALTIPCAYCGARPRQRCLRRWVGARRMSRDAAIKHYGPTGTASYSHTARSRPVYAIYWAGLEDGRAGG